MADEQPKITIIGGSYHGNRRDGIRIHRTDSAHIEDVKSYDNARHGLNFTEGEPPVESAKREPWFKRPGGILILSVSAGLILAAAKWGLPFLYRLVFP